MVSVVFYLGSILLANWLVVKFGLITVFGITFPAGAVAIGLTFSARDFVQMRFGDYGCWIWMVVASGITAMLSPGVAFASISVLVVAEGVDWVVFTFCRGSFTRRVLLSNLFGLPLDSVVFVWIAFGFNPAAMIGQTIVKLISSTAVVLPHVGISKKLVTNK